MSESVATGTTVPPAMDAIEWAVARSAFADGAGVAGAALTADNPWAALVALANDKLSPGAIHKLTRDDVARLAAAGDALLGNGGPVGKIAAYTYVMRIADKIAALLPPDA